MKAVGYVRVSTEGQAREGVSLEAQEARIRAWAQANGYELAGIHIDAGISGSKSDRPGLQAALTEACKLKAALVVYSMSRLARSTRDTLDVAERLQKCGADLVSLSEKIDTTSAAGKMVFQILAVLAEFERNLVRERTTAAMQYMKAQGRRVGTVPYGFKLAEDGTALLPEPSEQEVLSITKTLKAEGLTIRDIARRLNEEGYKTRTGGPWQFQYIPRILRAKMAA